MKRGMGFLVLLLSGGFAFAQADGGPAYGAIRTAQKVASTSSLLQVTGERGEPRPSQWTLLYSDPQARGGVREVVVAGDVIVSQRTPLRGYAGIAGQAPIKLTRLNLDSDAVFSIAEKQARTQRIGFNWVDYTLRTDESNGAPVWIAKLYNSMGAQVGTLEVSAENGAIIMPLRVTADNRPYENTEQFSDSPTGQRMGGVIGFVTGTVERTANTVKDVTLRTVGTVQEVLTGERTIGPKDDDENGNN